MSDLIRVKTPELADFGEISATKVYIYDCPAIGKNANMIAENTTSFIALSQKVFNDVPIKHKMLKDDNGNYYCEVIAAQTDTETFRKTSQTSSMAETLYRAKQFSMISNNFPDLYGDRTFMCSIDVPLSFNSQGVNTVDTPIYIISSNTKTANVDENWYMVEKDLMPQETYTEFNVIDISVVQEKYINCTINVYKNDNGVISDGITGFQVDIEQGGLLANNFCTILSNKNGKQKRLDLKASVLTGGNLYPIKMYDKFVDSDELELLSDWHDKSLYLPWTLAKLYQTPQDITKFFSSTPSPEEQGAIDLILDMLGMSYLYMTNFQPANAPDDWRLKPNAQTTGLGQIDAKFNFGKKYIRNVLQCSAQSPIVVIDGMFNDFVAQHPNMDIGLKRLVKSIIGALSRFIPSTYAFAGGMNDALLSLVPWYITPSKLSLVFNNDVVTLDAQGLLFALNSEYFTFGDNQTINPNFKDYNPNQVWEINGEQTQFVKKLPAIISPENRVENKDQLPSAMLTDGDEALEYIWLIPMKSSDDFSKLIEGSASGSGSKTIDITFSTVDKPFTDGILTPENETPYLTSYLQAIYGNNATITINNLGNIVPTYSPEIAYRDAYNGPQSQWPYASIYNQLLPHITGGAFGTIDDTGITIMISFILNIPIERIKLGAVQSRVFNRDITIQPNGIETNIRANYAIAAYYVDNAQATITYQTNIYKNNKLIFNSDEWYNYQKSQGVNLTGKYTLLLQESNNETMGNIQQIVFGSCWYSTIIFYISTFKFIVNSINSKDETVILQNILFS